MIRTASFFALALITAGCGPAGPTPERPKKTSPPELLPHCWLRVGGAIATGAEGATPRRPPVKESEIGPPDQKFGALPGWEGVEIGAPLASAERALEEAGIPFERQAMHKSATPYLSARWRELDVTIYTDGATPPRPPRVKQVLLKGARQPDLSAAEEFLRRIERELGVPQLGCHRRKGRSGPQAWSYHWFSPRLSMRVTLSQGTAGDWSTSWSFTGPGGV